MTQQKDEQQTETSKTMNSPISWPGGKRLLAKKIVGMFPEHTCYASVFAGALWDLFKKQPSLCEVVNDINGDLINFYRVIQKKPYQFLLEMQWDLISRKAYFEYKAALEKDNLTDVEKAKRFFYVLKTSFGSQGRAYGYVRTDHPKLNLIDIEKIILSTHERLKRVNIECLDWWEFIPKYDTPKTMFYLDPPYRCETSKKVYIQSLTDQDFIDFRNCLKGVKGMFLLSLNDDGFIRELFKDFKIEEVETLYTLSGSPKKVKEILIKNY